MQSRTKSILIHMIWGIAGFAIGATVVLLWVKKFSSEWVEAAGTWFGAIATVLALLWAVQTFRADQAQREAERTDRENEQRTKEIERADAEREAEASAEAAAVAEAAQVTLSLLGGSGYGTPPDMQMSSVRIVFSNDSDRAVVIDEIYLLPPLEPKRALRTPIRIQPNLAEERLVEIHPTAIEQSELSGTPLERFSGVMKYRHGGRAWSRTSDGQLLPGPQA